MGAEKKGETAHYLLASFDAEGRETDRRGLSARNDAEALRQAERARWGHEAAGESRLLVLERAEDGERVVVARLGSRRFEGVGEVAGGERRSWIVSSRDKDGGERRDVLNARNAEEAARMAARGGWGEVMGVEARPRPGEGSRR